MKAVLVLALLWIAATAGAQEAVPAAAAGPAAAEAAAVAPPAEVLEPTFLYEITRHLYRWYMDESDVEKQAGELDFPFWVRRADAPLDPGDRSATATILLPRMGIEVKVKKADYAIEELGLAVKSKGFRIVNVSREPLPAEPPPGAAIVKMDYAQMREELFRKRTEARFPDEAMQKRLRVAVRNYYHLDPADTRPREQVIHVAPLSPVANELWVFLETRKILVRFASDIDLENPEMWKHQTLAIRTYDILKQTVVSLNEAAGSNEFLTRDQVGRALFNCLVLGKRLSRAEEPEAARGGPP